MKRAWSGARSRDRRITACIPHYRCRRYIRRAVESLLAQTHSDLTVVVVNDGDPDPPWDLLADIRDPRLVRFNLPVNHGPYFALAVVLDATSSPYFLIQDADDWSSRTRAECLLDRLERDGSDLAISAQLQCAEMGGVTRALSLRWSKTTRNGHPRDRFVVNCHLTPEFAYRVPHAGLFRASSLRRVGGYYAGFRVGYDTLLTNLILMTGRISHVPEPLYYRLVRPESLTHSSVTGVRSNMARRMHHVRRVLYRSCFELHARYLAGQFDSQRLSQAIRACISRAVPTEEAHRLTLETLRLKGILRACIPEPA